MDKGKRTNNDLQYITHETIDRVTRSPLYTGVKTGAPEGLAVYLNDPVVVIFIGEQPEKTSELIVALNSFSQIQLKIINTET
jgi:hypothetical protein